MCVFKRLFNPNASPHCSHLCGFSFSGSGSIRGGGGGSGDGGGGPGGGDGRLGWGGGEPGGVLGGEEDLDVDGELGGDEPGEAGMGRSVWVG